MQSRCSPAEHGVRPLRLRGAATWAVSARHCGQLLRAETKLRAWAGCRGQCVTTPLESSGFPGCRDEQWDLASRECNRASSGWTRTSVHSISKPPTRASTSSRTAPWMPIAMFPRDVQRDRRRTPTEAAVHKWVVRTPPSLANHGRGGGHGASPLREADHRRGRVATLRRGRQPKLVPSPSTGGRRRLSH